MKALRHILIIGAGRSATALINYILQKSEEHQWKVIVADANVELVQQKIGNHVQATAKQLDVSNIAERGAMIAQADLVVSLLPAHLHMQVARDCLKYEKHLLTASYISEEMNELSEEARAKNLIFMGEIGLDPGIDHMSAMEKIDEIKEKGGKLTSFKSYTGGLIAPEYNTNPWNYKFTWNPRNVVLAGRGTAQYLEGGKYKYIPYNRLFQNHWKVEIEGMGPYEMYANRDSLLYRESYGLESIPTLIRGTLRNIGFCDAWAALVQIGLTDNSFVIQEAHHLTYRDLMESYLGSASFSGTTKAKIAQFLNLPTAHPVLFQLEWLGLFSETAIPLQTATPAQILEDLLLKKWALQEEDKDMILMQHEFEYLLNGRAEKLISTLIMKGKDASHTAMAKLVGLPLGIFAKEVMIGNSFEAGVQIPVRKEVYAPVLEELKLYGIAFNERVLVHGHI